MKQKNPYIHYGILFLIYAIGVITLLTHTAFHSMMHTQSEMNMNHMGHQMP
jgi:hypothetical protein